MILASLLIALLPGDDPVPATIPPEQSRGFVAESVSWSFDLDPFPAIWLLRTGRELPIVPEQGGLLIDPPPGGELAVVLHSRPLHGRGDLRIGWNLDLPPGTGLVLELAAQDGWFEGVEAPWVHVQSFGEVPAGSEVDFARASLLERANGGWCASTEQHWIALRLRAFRSAGCDRLPLAVGRLSVTLADQTTVATPRVRGYSCALGAEIAEKEDAEALQRAAELALLEFQPPPDSPADTELRSFASCAAMLASGVGRPIRAEALAGRVAQRPASLGERCQAVHELGCRTWLESYSTLPEVREAQGYHGPLALRVRGPEEWVVLGSLDRDGNARIYAPFSALPQPETWSAADLERRWFGAGGLAFACRR